MAQMLSLALLGHPQIELNETAVKFPTNKAQALICYLVMGDRPHSRSALAGLLWGDLPEAAARRNLRVELAKIRRQLADYLSVTRTTIGFNHTHSYWLDVDQLATAASAPLANLVETEQAVSLYRGDFLEDLPVREAPEFETWVVAQRERLRQMALNTFQALVNHYQTKANQDKALHYAQQMLLLDPWQEEIHYLVMQLFAQTGQRSAALAQYKRCQQTLAETMGVPPSDKTTALYEQIKQGHNLPQTIEQAGAPPPDATEVSVAPALQQAKQNMARSTHHNLPAQATSFVGRETEQSQIATLLEQANCRLITIVGPGGIGKTRLGLETAKQQLGTFTDGVYYVPLTALHEPNLLAASIVDTLPLSLSGPSDPRAQLLNYLRQKNMLLLLDNFEHLVTGADLLLEMLEQAPALKLIVTSRVSLGVAEEWLLSLSGLPFRPVAARPIAESCSAVKLFVERAQRIYLNFSPELEAKDVIRICQLVEGTPLGIELAAAWVRVLPSAEIVKEIERNLGFLETELDVVPSHQRSLRAVFMHSWLLLSAEGQTVFSRMSVFRGGFTRDAAEVVAGASLRILSTLIDKSFLQRAADGRYHVHELLRHFATEQLTVSDLTAAQGQHCRYFANFMRQRESAIMQAGEQEAITEIAAEIENVRAGWRCLVQRLVNESAAEADGTLLGQYLRMLTQFYQRRGLYREGQTVFEDAAVTLADSEWGQSDNGYATLLLAQIKVKHALFRFNLSQYDQVKTLIMENLPILRRFDAQEPLAEALAWLGYAEARTANYEAAEHYIQESLTIYKNLGNQSGIATALNGLALLANYQDRFAEAAELCRACLKIFREAGYQRGMGNVISNLGTTYARRGDTKKAIELYNESLKIAQAVGEPLLIATSLCNLGSSMRSHAEYHTAKAHLEESLQLFREIGELRWIIATLTLLGMTLIELGDLTTAKAYLTESLRSALEIHALPDALDSLPPLGRILHQTDQPEAALSLLTFAAHHPVTQALARENAETYLARIADQYPPDKVSQIRETVKEQSIEDLTALILNSPS